jgi:AraC family transcriptional regulator
MDPRDAGSSSALASLPFGRFFGRLAEEHALAGFVLTRMVPTVPKREIRRHQHAEGHFVFVLRGAYETGARPAAGRPDAPLLIYNPPGTEHADCFAPGDLERCAFATLSVAAPTLAAIETEVEMPPTAVCLSPSAAGLVRRILDEARGLQGDDGRSASILDGLCVDLLLRTGIERDRAKGAPGWLVRARELLRDTNLEDGARSVGEIAGALGVHPVHLARCFRRHFGVTPGEYLRRCRLDRAGRLLRQSALGLAEVAAATGFADQSHFSHAFRRRFGVGPGAFRRAEVASEQDRRSPRP